MQVIVDDLLTNYQQTSGKNLNILFIHGWADSIAGQKSFIDDISRIGNVLALDLPGFGTSQVPGRAFSLLDYAKFVRDFCDKTGFNKIDLIIGHSNGGAIAIKIVSLNLLNPKKLVLLGASGIRDGRSSKKTALAIVAKAGKIITSPLPKTMKKQIRSKAYKTIGSDYLVAEHMQETFKNVVSEDMSDDAKNINIPTLLIYGQDDDQTPPKVGLKYHEIINGSEIELVGGAGHFVQLDKPQIAGDLIRKFIS